MRARLAREFPGLKFSFQSGGIVSDVLNFGLPAPIDIKVSGPKLSEVAETASRIRDVVAQTPGTADVQVRQGMEYPELHLEVNRAKAAYLGLNEQRVVMDLIAAGRERREPACSAANARWALEMVMGVYQAALEGKRVAFPLAERGHPLRGV